MTASPRPARPLRVTMRYARTMAWQFRATWLSLLIAVAIGATLFAATPLTTLNGARPGVGAAVYAAWMALLAEQVFTVAGVWHLELLHALFPLIGAVALGEGVVRFALLMSARRAGDVEWMRVEASVLKDHVIVCGLGHLGVRVLEELVAREVPVIAIEQNATARHLARARQLDVVIFVRDIRDDQVLVDAGIERARAVVVGTDDDLANIEVALDARRMNPNVRIVMRQFDQELAGKIARSANIDAAFSSAALAAPVVVQQALGEKPGSAPAPPTRHALEPGFELRTIVVRAGGPHVGRTVRDVESEVGVRVLHVRTADGSVSLARADDRVAEGTELVVYGSVGT